MSKNYLYRAKVINDMEGWVEGYVIEKKCPEYHIYIVRECNAKIVEVDPETVCKCINIDEQIFEKDIFECDDDQYVIEWNEESLSFNAVSIHALDSISLGEFYLSEIDIIGNAIDNPELIEKKEMSSK